MPESAPQSWFPLVNIPGGGFTTYGTAIHYNGKTYIGYITPDGTARVVSYNETTHAIIISPAIVSGLGANYHNAPSLLLRSSDHKLVVAVCNHNIDSHLYVAISTNAEDVSAWGSATDIGATVGATDYTYAQLTQLSGESGKIYLFFRSQLAGNYRWGFSNSTDGGATWGAQTVLFANGATQAYLSYASDSTSRIDFVVSDGTATNGDTASMYHFYYTGGSYYKSDGTLISVALPLAPSNLTEIYDGATSGTSRGGAQCSIVGANLFSTWTAHSTTGGANQNYWYGELSSGTWTVNKIDDTGSVETSDIAEGDCSIDRIDGSIVYVSKMTSNRWQMFKYVTANSGTSWTPTQLTFDTDTQNFHPITPQSEVSQLKAIWMAGQPSAAAIGFAPFSQIRGYPNPRTI